MRHRFPLVSVAGVTASAAVVATLGILQYRWLGQLSAGEKQLMQAAAAESVRRLAGEVDAEVNDAFIAAQPPQGIDAASDPVERLRDHYETRSLPALVRAVVYLDGERAVAVAPRGAAVPPLPRPLKSPVDARLPGFVVPLFVTGDASIVQRGQVAVVFDRAHLFGVVLPALARRHLAGRYDFVVRDGDAVLAGTRPKASPDASAEAFSVLVSQSRRAPPNAQRLLVQRDARRVVRTAWLQFGEAPRGAWTIEVWHRAGSVEAAVRSLRRRNLAVAMTLLAMLAVSGAMLLVAWRRTRHLARQQLAFVSSVSHELRTPIAIIDSAAGNLEDGVVTAKEAVQRYGGAIRAESHRLARRIEQILDFGAGVTNRRHFAREAVPIADVVRQAVARSGARGVEVRIPPALPALRGDGDALLQAVENLVANADRHGQPPIVVTVEASAGELSIAVANAGPPLSRPELRRLFAPFYRGIQARDAQIRGSGLGLAIVKQIVTAHGGRVSVRSDAGQTVFVVTLPVEPGDA